jgi:hypothetical protein
MSNTALERSLLTINKVRDPDREQEEQDLFVFNDTKEGARIFVFLGWRLGARISKTLQPTNTERAAQ